jgi:hypothetical protein
LGPDGVIVSFPEQKCRVEAALAPLPFRYLVKLVDMGVMTENILELKVRATDGLSVMPEMWALFTPMCGKDANYRN